MKTTRFPDWWWTEKGEVGQALRTAWVHEHCPTYIHFYNVLINTDSGFKNKAMRRVWLCIKCSPVGSQAFAWDQQTPMRDKFGRDLFEHLESKEHIETILLAQLSK